MMSDFNAELHARPSIYFTGPAFVEHVALMPSALPAFHGSRYLPDGGNSDDPRTQVEHHTEFVTITRVTQLSAEADTWPVSTLSVDEISVLVDMDAPAIISRVGILVLGAAPAELGPTLSQFGFRDTAASSIGGGAAQVCSDFRVRDDQTSRILLFNKDLNACRLGRMVRRIYEIETYQSMALLGLPEARRLAATDVSSATIATRGLWRAGADRRVGTSLV